MAMSTTDHYTIISADMPRRRRATSSTASTWTRRTVDEFDAWRNKYKNPYRDLRRRRVRNWDDERRNGDMRPTASSPRSSSPTRCRRSSRASCCSPSRPKPEQYAQRHAGIQAHNRWLVDFCAASRAARRHRPDLPQRHRRRHRGRASGSRSTACAAACCCRPPARRDVGASRSYDPDVRPAVGGAARTSASPSTARRHRLARLRQVPGGAD